MKFEDKIRVLIVDDSAVMRRIIMTSLMKHSDIEVVGTAANGLLAIEAIKRSSPDIVTLDVEMPEMDGITALREIRKIHPTLPIIMFSSLTQRGAKATMDALTYGASDYVGKPQASSNPADAYKVLEESLIPKIKALCQRESGKVKKASSIKERGAARREALSIPVPEKITTLPSEIASSSSSTKVIRPEGRPLYPVDALCIGVSTGGPAALMKVFELWRTPLTVPIFIVQHMPPKFTTLLAARLTEIGVMPVQEPYDGQEAVAGHAYLAPGGYHLELRRKGTKVFMYLNEDPPENSCRPAVDVLFRSAAKVYGQSLLAVVLTGMGYDGLRGAEDIIRSNGVVLAQDKETSVIWGMPGAIAQADLAEKVLPLEAIPDEILFRTQLK
ncbi:chemotaxis response regulator protein-glutamate methylesterase [Polynucleobacter sp. UB-Tiil-W10]|uniref:protein-glutamate methylesterase/protein-glutamine glutaminase n=1 Tax=Polynucleobacter sp. UB-Tiil-W10 TaxID=1855648 RepID=UPI001C0C66FC|nr:chemotaxis response regulator protein-glutamate methylesterase [Polynucleobacter sp. UB-Tiil-W10]MBU3541546.1 chemotaxis response regulator protein-glutamate methylesterase [Polynucleobacter sp. UB-Tiil-W10]